MQEFNRALKVILPLIAGALAVDVLFYYFGMMINVPIDAWPIIGVFMIFLFLYTQVDINRARTQRGLDTDVLDYLWVPATIPIIAIAVVFMPAHFAVPFFTYIAFMISAAVFVLIYIFHEMDYPGWFARHIDKEARETIIRTRATNKALNDDGVRQVAYGFMSLGIGLGAVLGVFLLFFLSAPGLFFLLLIGSIFLGAMSIFGYTGAWIAKKSCIDKKLLVEE